MPAWHAVFKIENGSLSAFPGSPDIKAILLFHSIIYISIGSMETYENTGQRMKCS